MRIDPVLAKLDAALESQLALVAGTPELETAVGALSQALRPALREAALDLAAQAADEVRAQLPDRRVEVVLDDGDPVLRIGEGDGSEPLGDEDFGARITLRLPPRLKDLIEDAAGQSGDSVNTWVVRSLASRTRESRGHGGRVTRSFDL